MRTVAIIQARMGSSRLPGKVAEVVAGKPLLAHMIERVKRCDTLDDVVVAIPTVDYVFLHDIVRTAGARVFSWVDEEDVLTRVLMAAHGWQADLIVELTADCPLIDPWVVDGVVKAFVEEEGLDFCANTIEVRDALGLQGHPTYPRGMDVRVFPTNRLQHVAATTQDPADHEHVSLYFWEHLDQFALRWVPAPSRLFDDASLDDELRLTVDTPQDLALVRVIFDALYPADPAFALSDVLAFLAGRPDLRQLNRGVQQKEAR